MNKLSVQDIDLHGRRVLMRVDFNVPLDTKGGISDDTRIRASLATMEYVVSRGGIPILMSHLGRPAGRRNDAFSLRPIADHLGKLTSTPILFAEDCVGDVPRRVVASAKPGQVVLLENVRFHAAETENDAEFSRQLAELGDLYVNDAFGTAHRAHASTVGVTQHFELRASGLLMDRELQNLGALLHSPRRPYIAILGGAKVSGKIEIIENLLDRVDSILIGGGMAFTFFKVHGIDVGDSLVEDDLLDTVRKISERARSSSTQLLLPQDLIVADQFSNEAQRREVLVTDIPEGWQGLDIGPRTTKLFGEHIERAKTIFWNGPMGVFEMPHFARGTRAIARHMGKATDREACTVVGGGDSVAALRQMDVDRHITHVSTGGGAALEFLAGKTLPGVDALSDATSMPV
jgi:phosphoglycerate kinase